MMGPQQTTSSGLGQRRGVQTKRHKLSFGCILVGILAFLAAYFFFLIFASEEPVLLTSSSSLTALSNKLSLQKSKPTTIAYAISLIKCGDFQSSAEGLSDAAIILRHSIHQTSSRNPESGSRYDYKMYAIVHSEAASCSTALQDAGFEVIIRPPPVKKEEIRGDYLRTHIHKEWCCGHDEFIKLYAYTLEEPIVVHVDVDFVMRKPMDDLFDVMLDSNNKVAAKARIPRERPNDPWPEQVDAFMTRDWPQVIPGRIPGFQAGFIVLRPNQSVFDEIVQVIKEGNYVGGFQRENGWSGKGYGGYVGAMAMQGLLAYYYDVHRPNTWVELNQCRFNHMGLDVLYRNQPSFRPNHPKRGKCRNDRDYCEDCMHTELDKIYSIHYTYCRKPWNCIGEGAATQKGKLAVQEPAVELDHCLQLQRVWHDYRTDLETKLRDLTGDDTIAQGQTGDYKKDIFQGHCEANNKYLNLSGKRETMQRMMELYR